MHDSSPSPHYYVSLETGRRARPMVSNWAQSHFNLVLSDVLKGNEHPADLGFIPGQCLEMLCSTQHSLDGLVSE